MACIVHIFVLCTAKVDAGQCPARRGLLLLWLSVCALTCGCTCTSQAPTWAACCDSVLNPIQRVIILLPCNLGCSFLQHLLGCDRWRQGGHPTTAGLGTHRAAVSPDAQ